MPFDRLYVETEDLNAPSRSRSRGAPVGFKVCPGDLTS